MPITVRMRCQGCGSVLKTSSANSGRQAQCPKCNATFTVPFPPPSEARQALRAIVQELSSQPCASESSGSHGTIPFFRVVYTEADPAQFALARENRVPVLDISAKGLRFLTRTEGKRLKLVPGQTILLEIDFPNLVKPIKTPVEVRWAKPLEGYKLQQVGVEFTKPDREFRAALDDLVSYVLSRQ